MLSKSSPRRDVLLSPLPRGLSPWGSLNSPTSINSMTVSHPLDQLDSPVSSRPETPTIIPRFRAGRNGSGAGGNGGTIIKSWGSGGVLLDNVTKKSPTISSQHREEYPQSIRSIDSWVSSPRSPSLNRKKGSFSLLRLQQSREEVPHRIMSQRELEEANPPGRVSLYRSPTVENAEDAFFTGGATPDPVRPQNVNGGRESRPNSQDRHFRNSTSYPQRYEEKNRRPSTVIEDVPDCQTPNPQTKDPKPTLDEEELQETVPKAKQSHGVNSPAPHSASSPSTLLRLKYPSTHSATIEIQHRETIRITTSGRGGNGSSRISIQVDMDACKVPGYTSTIHTGGRRGGMSVTVRPSSKDDHGVATADIVPSSSKHQGNGEEDEEELVVASTLPTARKSRHSKSHRHSHKSSKHRSFTPPRQPSVNLIDLSSGGERSGSPETAPEIWRTVRKMEKSDDLKRVSASGSRIHSVVMSGNGLHGPVFDRPVSLTKRTSGTSAAVANQGPLLWNDHGIQEVEEVVKMTNGGIEEGLLWQTGDDDQTIAYDHEVAWPDSPTLRDPPPGVNKPRPLSNSNVPVEVALTMGFRGVTAMPPGSGEDPIEPAIPGMVPVLPNGVDIMGMEAMEGGWI